MDIGQINTAIVTGTFTADQLNSIVDAVKFARSRVATATKFSLVKGNKVKFTNSRTGSVMQGDVVKINRLRTQVKVGMTTWNVPHHMLTKV
jgi:hypothetical protein